MKMMISKERLISYVLLIMITVPSFVKGFIWSIYGSSGNLRIVLLGVIGSSLILIVKKKPDFRLLDLFWIGVLLFYVFWRDESKYDLTFALLITTAFIVGFFFRSQILQMDVLMKLVFLFSIVAMLVTWMELVFPDLYFSTITPLFSQDMQTFIRTQYNMGNLCGITYHYSANAFYIVSGILVVMAELFQWPNLKQKYLKITLALFQLVTLFAIGKRGHLLFLGLSAFLAYIVIAPNFFVKVKKSFKFVFIIVILAIVILALVPQARFILQRVVETANSADFTNYRSELYILALALFVQSPIWGNEIGSFSASTNFIFNGVHNDYIQLLCETGIIGFTIFLIANIATFIWTWRMLKKIWAREMNIRIRSLILYSFLFQAFFLMYSFTGIPRFDYEISIIYILVCSIPFGLEYRSKKRKEYEIRSDWKELMR